MDLLSKMLTDWRQQTATRRNVEAPHKWWRRTRADIYTLLLVINAIMIVAAAGLSQVALYSLSIAAGVLAVQMLVFGYLADTETHWPRQRLMTAPLSILFFATGVVALCAALATSTWTFLFPAAVPLVFGGWQVVSSARSSLNRIRHQTAQRDAAGRAFGEGPGQGV